MSEPREPIEDAVRRCTRPDGTVSYKDALDLAVAEIERLGQVVGALELRPTMEQWAEMSTDRSKLRERNAELERENKRLTNLLEKGYKRLCVAYRVGGNQKIVASRALDAIRKYEAKP